MGCVVLPSQKVSDYIWLDTEGTAGSEESMIWRIRLCRFI